MNTRVWTPIRPDGTIDEAELRRPMETSEPATWEAPWIPGDGRDASGDLMLLDMVRAARACPRHRFVFVAREPAKVAAWQRWSEDEEDESVPAEFPFHVTIAVGPLRTQAEADAAIPALLKVKAARREVVFAPTEAIDLDPPHCQHCFRRGTEEHGIADDGTPWCTNCYSEMCFGWFFGGVPQPDAVRVRGGAPEHVASLREQCQRRRRRARRRCPTTRARRAAVDCPSPARHRRKGDDDMSSDEQREGARAWTKERAKEARARLSAFDCSGRGVRNAEDLSDALDAIDERDATIAELEAHLVTMTAAHAKAANERDAFARSRASYQTLCEGLTRSVEDLSAALERERAKVQQSSAPSPSAEGAKLEPAADDGEIDRWEAQLARRRASMADTAKGGAS